MSRRFPGHPAQTMLGGVLLSLILAASAATAATSGLAPLRGTGSPFFSADVVVERDAEGHPALSITISVPHVELQWIRNASGTGSSYDARLEFTVVLESKPGEPLAGDLWERYASVATFESARSGNATVVERRRLNVPPGKYALRVRVRDMNGGSESSAEERLEIPDYTKMTVGFSDLELGVVDSLGAFRPVPTRVFGIEVRRLAARVVLFDRRPGDWPRHYVFRYRLIDDSGEVLANGPLEADLGRSAEPLVLRPASTNLFLGLYELEIELVDGKSKWRVERSFEVDESGPPTGREFERMLEPLSYIANSDEIERLRDLKPDQQARGWEEFWRRRDPTPDTPRNEALIEFFRRMRHAERQFQGFGPGWRSDMGRIYIKYGPPDQVDSRPASSQSPPMEIWYYNDPPRRYAFVDREGLGRYVLVNAGAE